MRDEAGKDNSDFIKKVESIGKDIGNAVMELNKQLLKLFVSAFPVEVQEHLLKANKEFLQAMQSLIDEKLNTLKGTEKKEFKKIEIK